MPIPLLDKLQRGFVGTGGLLDDINVETQPSGFSGNLASVTNNLRAALTSIDGFAILSGVTLTNRNLVFTRVSGADVTIELPAITREIVPTRALSIFQTGVTITSANINDFANKNNVYAATADQRVTFFLPLEADISAYPILFEISNFGGTARFDQGAAPTNTVVVDTQAGDTTDITVGGSIRAFVEAHRGDTLVASKTAAGQDWIVVEGSADPRSAILSSGVFRLQSRTINVSGSTIAGLTNFAPSAGDAFTVNTGGTGFAFPVNAGDVMVAKVDGPSVAINGTNEDWLVIRDSTNSFLKLAEVGFLAQVIQTATEERSESRIDDARFWLLDTVPVTAPDLGDASTGSLNVSTAETNKILLIAWPTANELSEVRIRQTNAGTSTPLEFPAGTSFVDMTAAGVGPAGGRTYFMAGSNATTPLRGIYTPDETIEAFATEKINRYTLSNQVDTTSNVGKLALANMPDLVRAAAGHAFALTGRDFNSLDTFAGTTLAFDLAAGTNFHYKRGAVSADISDYQSFEQSVGIPPAITSQAITFAVPTGATNVGLQKRLTPATTETATFIETFSSVIGTQRFTFDAYSATLPATTAGVSSNDEAYIVTGNGSSFTPNGFTTAVQIHRNNLDASLQNELDGGASQVPAVIQQLAAKLSDTTVTVTTDWTERAQRPIRGTLTRLAAWGWTEDRTSFGSGNFFTDITPAVLFDAYALNRIFFYPSPTSSANTTFPGVQSFIYHDNVRLQNASGDTPIADDWNKLILFDYRLTRLLGSNERFNMLRIGDTSAEALIQEVGGEGLVLRIGRGDGGAQSRTERNFLQVDNNQWRISVGQSVNDELEIIIPDDLTGSLTVFVDEHRFNNNNDEGDDIQQITIANVAVNQTLANVTFDNSPHANLVLSAVYEAANTDITDLTRRVLILSTTTPLNNAAEHFEFTAYTETVISWNQPESYADEGINAGSPFDRNGVYSPSLYTNESTNVNNRIMVQIIPVGGTTTTGDLELGARVIVDGQLAGEASTDHIIALGRHVGDFDFNDIRFGIGSAPEVIGHIQVYDYQKTLPPSADELVTLYNGRNPQAGLGNLGLGYFDPPGHNTVEDFKLDADLILQPLMAGAQVDIWKALQNANGWRTDTLLEDASVTTSNTSVTFPTNVTDFTSFDYLLINGTISGITHTAIYVDQSTALPADAPQVALTDTVTINFTRSGSTVAASAGTVTDVTIRGIRLQSSVPA